MPNARARLDVWAPRIQPCVEATTSTLDSGGNGTAGNFLTEVFADKWVTCETQNSLDLNITRKNALTDLEITDTLYRPRRAVVTIVNPYVNFKIADEYTYEHIYRDSDGNNYLSANSGVVHLRKIWGPFDYFFRLQQPCRIVDTATNLVLFSGKILYFTAGHDDTQGQIVTVEMADSLAGLLGNGPKDFGLLKTIKFPNEVRRSSMVKTFLELGVTPETVIRDTASSHTSASAGLAAGVHELQTADAQTDNRLRRFQESPKGIDTMSGVGPYLTLKQSIRANWLEIITDLAVNEPHEDATINANFGFDFFVDSNITKTDFTGSNDKYNLDATLSAPSEMFNYHKRGSRLSKYSSSTEYGEPRDVGLSIVFPVSQHTRVDRNVFDKATYLTGTHVTNGAIKRMAPGFKFKDELGRHLTHVAATYEAYRMLDDDDDELIFDKRTIQKDFEIMYVSHVTGTFAWAGTRFDANFQNPQSTASQAEYIDVYSQGGTFLYDGSTAGSSVSEKVARIQYQGNRENNGATHEFILLSDVGIKSTDTVGYTPVFPTANIEGEDYVILKGRSSGATCRLNLNSNDYLKGRPSSILGRKTLRKAFTGLADVGDLDQVRESIGAALNTSMLDLQRGTVSVAGLPYYFVDCEIHGTPTTITDYGQRIVVHNGTAAFDVVDVGFREGMMIAKMDSDYKAIATSTVNGKPLYGYCSQLVDKHTMQVKLNDYNTTDRFAENDPVRLFIPLRIGDNILIDNVLSKIYGGFTATKITYKEGHRQGSMTTVELVGRKTKHPHAGGDMRDPQRNPLDVPLSHGGMAPVKTVIKGLPSPNAIAESQHSVFAVNPANVPNSIPDNSIEGFQLIFPAVNNRLEWAKTGSNAGTIRVGDIGYFNLEDSTGTTTSGTSQASPIGLGSSGMADNTPYMVYIDVNQDSDTRLVNEALKIQTKAMANFNQLNQSSLVKLWTVRKGGTKVYIEKSHVTIVGPQNITNEADLVVAPDSLTATLLSKAARPWTSNLEITGTAYNAIEWDNGTSPSGTDAILRFSDGTDIITINAASKSATSSPPVFTDNSTTYMYLDGVSGTLTPIFTQTHSATVGKILLAIIVVGINTQGNKPIILPFNSKKPTLNAVAMAADFITATHIKTGTISADRLTSGAQASITEKTITHVGNSPPDSPRTMDIWFDTNSTPTVIKVWDGDSWEVRNDNAPAGSGATVFRNYQEGVNAKVPNTANSGSINNIPNVPVKQYDLWMTHDTNQLFQALHPTNNDSISAGEWTLKNDADAINYAETSINGGLIKTQRIKLLDGGSLNSTANAFETTLTGVTSTLREIDDSGGISSSDTTFGIDAWSDNGGDPDDLRIYAGDVIQLTNGSSQTEAMFVVSGSDTSLTVKRGWLGTTAVAHADNALISKYNYSVTALTDPHIILDNAGITGYSDAFTPEFSLSSETGKGVFGGGNCLLGEGGLTMTGSGTPINMYTSRGGIHFWGQSYDSGNESGIIFRSFDNSNNTLDDPYNNYLTNHGQAVMGLGHETWYWGSIYSRFHFIHIESSVPSDSTVNYTASNPPNHTADWGAMYIRGTNVYVKIAGTEHQVSGGGGGFTSFKWGLNESSSSNYYTITDGDNVFLSAGGSLSITKTGDNYLQVNHQTGASGTYKHAHITTNIWGHIVSATDNTRLRPDQGSLAAPEYSFAGGAGNETAAGKAGMNWSNSSIRFAVDESSRFEITDGRNANFQTTVGVGVNLGESSGRWYRLYASNASDISSDVELKENLNPISDGLGFISRLNPLTFTRKESTEIEFGFTAQEMKQAVLDSGYTEDMGVYSETLDEDTGETHWGITYSTLVAPLVAAIQELKARIEVLEGN